MRHTPQAATLTRISPGPGSGTGRSTGTNGPLSIGPGTPTAHARITVAVSLIGTMLAPYPADAGGIPTAWPGVRSS